VYTAQYSLHILEEAFLSLYDVFRYGHGILFVALQTALMFGFFLEWLRDRRSMRDHRSMRNAPSEDLPGVSVIIPIHNESRRMGGLLRSLLEQDYPAEIIFVDDRSGDESPAMLARFVRDAAGRGMNNCRVITLRENPGPNRKQYALARGIAESRGEYLLFTDGDCEVPPCWIRAMARRMADGRTGALIGPVFKQKQGKGFFFLYQCYDHAVRYNYLAGSIGLGAAGGGFGNNLMVNRKALDAAGGYEAVPPSPTEDAALISQIRSGGKYRVRAIALPDAAVETGAEPSWRAFISQTLRWNNGGLFSPEPLTRFNYNFLMLIISTGILALPLLPVFPGLWPMPAGVFIVMIENTIAAFGLFRAKLPRSGLRAGFGYLAALLFPPVYFTLMTIMGYCGITVKWKGERIPHKERRSLLP
jgi:cellulose synthase/poly-beta-1,6-N-acetylglucosamine synthase-like glycosyltransferase